MRGANITIELLISARDEAVKNQNQIISCNFETYILNEFSMKMVLFFSILFLASISLNAQNELDSIVVIENEVIDLDTYNCEQLSTYRNGLDKKYHTEYFKAMELAGEMSRKVSPCYFYRVEVKIKRRFNEEIFELKNCNIYGMGCSVFAQDYTFYIIKERLNPLFVENPGTTIICDYDIKNLPDNR